MNPIETFLKDDSYIGIVIVLDVDLNILQSNKNFTDLIGYSDLELSKIKFVDLILPADKSIFYDVLYDSLITQDITIKLYTKTGAFRFFSIVVQTFGDCFLILGNSIKKDFIGYDYHSELDNLHNTYLIDIEADNISELIGFESEAFKVILDSLPLDVWVKNKYGKYVYVNKTFSKHTGHDNHYIKGKNDFELFEPQIAKEFETSDNTAIESKEQLNYVFESKSDKLLTWTEVTKIPVFNKHKMYIGIIGYSKDISDHKKLETIHKIDKQKYKKLSQQLSDLVFEVDSKGNVLYVSGELENELDIDVNQENAAKLFIQKQKNPHLEEKIQIALKGIEVEFEIDVNGAKVAINLYPIKDIKGDTTILGFGKKVGGGNV